MFPALRQLAHKGLPKLIGPRNYTRIKFYKAHGSLPNLDDPKTFNEKIAWRKLYDRDDRMKIMADKWKVKPIIAAMIGEQHVIPTLGVYDLPEDVPLEWDFPVVVKSTQGSGTNLFLRTPKDREGAVEKLKAYLRYDHSLPHQEWAYGFKPRLIVEPMMLIDGEPPSDYKFHVFGGKAFAVQVDLGRFNDHRRRFYTRDWKAEDYVTIYPLAEVTEAPDTFAEMLRFAELIGGQFSYARVDFYEYLGRPVFGEITFYPGGGKEPFGTPGMDRIYGDLWAINQR